MSLSAPAPCLYPDHGQTAAFLSHLLDPSIGCIEMRVFHATISNGRLVEPAERYSKTLAGWYDDSHALIVDAMRLREVSAYVTVNPVSSALLARSYNNLSKAKHATNDDDIQVIRWLYVDIDPIRPADISSTDDELSRAIDKRDAIIADHEGWHEAALYGCSGNGAWILVRLPDLDNTKATRRLMGEILKELANKYNDKHVTIDVKTKNPSRVMCLPGTLKCKGSNIPARPHRLVTFDGPRQIEATSSMLKIAEACNGAA